MPPMETVKNSSTLGPMPSSGDRTDFERATPAKNARNHRHRRLGSNVLPFSRCDEMGMTIESSERTTS
eukprot:3806458-Prymnesium_polylepis.1